MMSILFACLLAYLFMEWVDLLQAFNVARFNYARSLHALGADSGSTRNLAKLLRIARVELLLHTLVLALNIIFFIACLIGSV